jgi:excisionase family DNA binding protein
MEIYDLKAVGEKLGISVRGIRELIRRGELRARKVGRAYLVTPEELTRLLEPPPKEEPPPGPPPPEDFLTVTEFFEKTMIPPVKIRQWLREGILRGTKDPGGVWHVDPEMLRWWKEIQTAMRTKKKKS